MKVKIIFLNLKSVNIQNIGMNNYFTDLAKLNTIKILKISFDKDILSSITLLKNLEILYCWVNLTDESLNNLTKCIMLKQIRLFIGINYLTQEGQNNFAKLQKIELLELYFTSFNINNILNSISMCKNINNLIIKYCKFDYAGLESINLMSQLNILNISYTCVTSSQIINIVDKLANLKKLYINSCNPLSFSFLKTLNEIKANRNDRNILLVYIGFNQYSYFVKNLDNNDKLSNLPYVSLNYEEDDQCV